MVHHGRSRDNSPNNTDKGDDMTSRILRMATTLGAMAALTAGVTLSAHPEGADAQAGQMGGTVAAQPWAPQSATTITTCTGGTIAISAPGNYKLDGGAKHRIDCPASAGPAIAITASHVQLDLGTTRLGKTGSGANIGILVAPAVTGTRLEDVHIGGPGAVVGFKVGIEIDNVDNSEVEGVTVPNSITHGIQTSSVVGLALIANTLTRNGWFGLNLVDSIEGRVRRNVVDANGIAKGTVTTTTDTTLVLTLNTAPKQIGIGIGIFGGRGNEVEGNTVTANFGIGIVVDANSTDNSFRRNQAAGNQNYNGSAVAGSVAVFTNFFFGTGSTGNEVADNVILSVEDDNVCGNNSFRENTIINSTSNNGTTAVVGTYLAPLSLLASQVDSPSLCIW